MATHAEQGSNGASERTGFTERIDHIGSSAQTLWTEASGALTDIKASIDLQGRLQKNPYGVVAAAVGVGYLLGGGLFTPLTARLVRMGLKLAALPFVKDELMAMAENAVDGFVSRAGQNRPEAGFHPGGDQGIGD